MIVKKVEMALNTAKDRSTSCSQNANDAVTVKVVYASRHRDRDTARNRRRDASTGAECHWLALMWEAAASEEMKRGLRLELDVELFSVMLFDDISQKTREERGRISTICEGSGCASSSVEFAALTLTRS